MRRAIRQRQNGRNRHQHEISTDDAPLNCAYSALLPKQPVAELVCGLVRARKPRSDDHARSRLPHRHQMFGMRDSDSEHDASIFGRQSLFRHKHCLRSVRVEIVKELVLSRIKFADHNEG